MLASRGNVAPNENTNGLVRQHFPKGTDLSIFNLDDLRAVEERLNATDPGRDLHRRSYPQT